MMLPLLILFLFWISPASGSEDYAAWSKEDPSGFWTQTAEEAVGRSGLPDVLPEDIERFCPGYPEREREERVRFWVGLLSAMARAESDCRTKIRHLEAVKDRNGRNVISRGLLQLSIESANQSRYDCRIPKAEDLHHPAVNLACAVKILGYWVLKERSIAATDSSPKGGGRYWATLRESHPRLPDIARFTRNLTVCRSSPRPSPSVE